MLDAAVETDDGRVRAEKEAVEPVGDTCEDLDNAPDDVPQNILGECQERPRRHGSWVYCGLCLACGHVGCSTPRPQRHATAHFHDTAHRVMPVRRGRRATWRSVLRAPPDRLSSGGRTVAVVAEERHHAREHPRVPGAPAGCPRPSLWSAARRGWQPVDQRHRVGVRRLTVAAVAHDQRRHRVARVRPGTGRRTPRSAARPGRARPSRRVPGARARTRGDPGIGPRASRPPPSAADEHQPAGAEPTVPALRGTPSRWCRASARSPCARARSGW